MPLPQRIEAATPTGRDRAVDGLRAIAILGVVLGHWLVTVLTVEHGTPHVTSPLQRVPALVPASWLFQTLAVFFFVGGLVAARSPIDRYGEWLRTRLTRLFRPVCALLAVWTTLTLLGVLLGVASRTVLKLVLSPLWFLLVFAALTAATPLVRRLHPAWPVAVVAAVDVCRFAVDLPGRLGWIGWLNLAAGWLVPYCLGASWSRGALRDRTTAWLLLIGGTGATLTLIHWAGYPASMVGVPGDGRSNLNPPSLAAVTFGLAQCGLALLVLEPLRRVLRRPAAWAAVALLNLSAMTVFMWHQTALIAVTLLVPGPLPGLHTAPGGCGGWGGVAWLAARLAWLPVFAVALLLLWSLFRRYERRR
jgi:hypothetical protein